MVYFHLSLICTDGCFNCVDHYQLYQVIKESAIDQFIQINQNYHSSLLPKEIIICQLTILDYFFIPFLNYTGLIKFINKALI